MNYGAELPLVAAARGDVLHTVVPEHRGADHAEACRGTSWSKSERSTEKCAVCETLVLSA
jgi:hypothetical protein